ncbi:hypothetical protein FKM82_006918 [Ascaphus truei]
MPVLCWRRRYLVEIVFGIRKTWYHDMILHDGIMEGNFRNIGHTFTLFSTEHAFLPSWTYWKC